MTSRLGSKDNIKHVPGGGNVSNVTACGVAVVQTNTVTVPHDALRPNKEALSLLIKQKRARRNAAKSNAAELHFPKQIMVTAEVWIHNPL